MVTPAERRSEGTGRPGLADAHGHRGGVGRPAGQRGGGKPFGQMLEQLDVGPRNHGRHRLGDRPVVDRVGQPVRPAGGPEVELQIQVHLEGLGPLAAPPAGRHGPRGPAGL